MKKKIKDIFSISLMAVAVYGLVDIWVDDHKIFWGGFYGIVYGLWMMLSEEWDIHFLNLHSLYKRINGIAPFQKEIHRFFWFLFYLGIPVMIIFGKDILFHLIMLFFTVFGLLTIFLDFRLYKKLQMTQIYKYER